MTSGKELSSSSEAPEPPECEAASRPEDVPLHVRHIEAERRWKKAESALCKAEKAVQHGRDQLEAHASTVQAAKQQVEATSEELASTEAAFREAQFRFENARSAHEESRRRANSLEAQMTSIQEALNQAEQLLAAADAHAKEAKNELTKSQKALAHREEALSAYAKRYEEEAQRIRELREGSGGSQRESDSLNPSPPDEQGAARSSVETHAAQPGQVQGAASTSADDAPPQSAGGAQLSEAERSPDGVEDGQFGEGERSAVGAEDGQLGEGERSAVGAEDGQLGEGERSPVGSGGAQFGEGERSAVGAEDGQLGEGERSSGGAQQKTATSGKFRTQNVPDPRRAADLKKKVGSGTSGSAPPMVSKPKARSEAEPSEAPMVSKPKARSEAESSEAPVVRNEGSAATDPGRGPGVAKAASTTRTRKPMATHNRPNPGAREIHRDPPAFRLKNAKEGETYDEPLEGPAEIEVHRVNGLEETGLAFGEGRVRGRVASSFERKLTVVGRWRATGEAFTGEVSMIANPDPRRLWTEKEPTDDRFRKDHLDSASLETDLARIVVASRRGRSHAHAGSYREDDFRVIFHSDSGWILLALSDGAGSAKYSRLGSKLTCEIAVERVQAAIEAGKFTEDFGEILAPYVQSPQENRDRLVQYIWGPLVQDSMYEVLTGLDRQAKSEQIELNSLAATLLFTMCRKYDFGWLFIGFGIGDGVTAIHRRGQEPILLIEPDGGEYAGQTRFVTMRDVWLDQERLRNRLHVQVVPEITALASMTDGVSDPKFESEAGLRSSQGWDKFFDELGADVNMNEDLKATEQGLLEWLKFFKQGEHDDRTLALLVPR